MIRVEPTEDQQAAMDAWRSERNVPTDVVLAVGTNLIVGDLVRIVDAFDGYLVGPEPGGGTVYALVPEWGDPIIGFGDLEDYVTDRAGPNGETMPIFDDEEEEEEEPPPAPQGQQQQQRQPKAKLSKAERHAKRHDLQAFLKAQSPEVAKLVRKNLHLDKDKP
jgi:hypothetical protein